MAVETKTPRTRASGGCSLGCASVFVATGLLWPFLHFIGGSREPDEAMFIPIVIGAPAFFIAHVLAALAIRSGSAGNARRGRRALQIIWAGVAMFILIGLLAWLVQSLRGSR